jgi:uncharacterized protein (DUF427 family)
MADATRVKVERCAKRLRVYIAGEIIADSIHAKLVWELTHYPTYYFPAADVRMAYLSESDRAERPTLVGQARYFDVRYRNRVVANAAWCYPESPILDIRGYVRFAWDQMEAWFEEEEEVFVHARSVQAHRPFAQLAPRRNFARRCEARRHAPADHRLRNRRTGPLLRAEDRHTHGIPRTHEQAHRLRVQGIRALLERQHGENQARRHRLVVCNAYRRLR